MTLLVNNIRLKKQGGNPINTHDGTGYNGIYRIKSTL